MSFSKTGRRMAALIAAAGFFLSGCGSAPLPDVSFYGNGAWTTTGPALWCTNEGLEYRCPAEIADVTTTLTLGKGQGIQVSVPSEISDGFWVITITYLDASGTQQAAATQVFHPGDKITHRVLVQPDWQLFEVDVQALTPTAADELRPWGAWVLKVIPAQRYVPPAD